MYSVLIVDDSATARLALRNAIERDSELYVIGEAECGREALTLARRFRPAVITMDVMMRRESGIDVAAMIMAQSPCPIVLVTACDTSDPNLTYQALQVGALELVSKLPGPFDADYVNQVTSLTRLLRNVAKIPVVTRHRRDTPKLPAAAAPTRKEPRAAPKLIVLGASTGGPNAVRELLAALPPKQPVPIALAQHIARGFGSGFAEWLAHSTGHRAVYCSQRTALEPGVVYVAPDDGNLALDGHLALSPIPAEGSQTMTSVDVLFESAAATFGACVVGVLMTGMGRDGAKGMQALARAGATTIVQDPESCTVSSMPEAALLAAPDSTVLRPSAIPEMLLRLVRGR